VARVSYQNANTINAWRSCLCFRNVQARKGDVDINELTLPTQLESERAYAEFQQNWDDACKAGNPKLIRVLWKTFGKASVVVGQCMQFGT
jgi:hypothetical protein